MENEAENLPTIELVRERAERKVIAFVMTFAACFVLLALLWPLSVTGFRTKASVSVVVGESDSAKQQFQDTLIKFIRSRTDDSALNRLVAAVKQDRKLENPGLKSSDFEKIRQSLSVDAIPTESLDGFRLDFSYEGNGSDDERLVVQLLADDLANALIGTANQNTSQESMIGRLEWLVSQVEGDLDSAKNTLNLIEQGTGQNAGKSNPFRNASHRSEATSNGVGVAGLGEVRTSLDAIDVVSLRNTLGELRGARGHAGGSVSSRRAVSEPETRPIGGVPKTAHVALIGLLSLLVGSVVATNYQAFSPNGFEDTSTVASRLNIPVLASIPSRLDASKLESDSPGVSVPIANRIVGLAKAVLIGLIGITILVCCLSPEIRHAFLENPFHGFSRLVWILVGY